MTKTKQLFLTLFLLAAQSAFCMDMPKSPDGKTGWVKIRKLSDFSPFVGKFFKHMSQARQDPTIHILFSNPKEDLWWPCLPSPDKEKFFGELKIGLATHYLQKGQGPLVRLLTFEELREWNTALKNKTFSPINHRNEVVFESKDFFRLSHLTSDEQERYLKQLPAPLDIADDPILKFE
jgi:hypothetical protein